MKIDRSRVAVITGASSGIGKELAFQMAARSCAVVLAARNGKLLHENVEEIQRRGGRALAVVADVSQRADVENIMALAEREFGRIDIVINNAGISPAFGTLLENKEEDVRATMEVNFMGSIYGVWAAAPYLEKVGGGLMVFVSSIIGKRGIPRNSVYCASKFAIQGLTESIRPELKRKNIRVITICPPGVDTAFFQNNGKGDRRRFSLHPVDKIARRIVRACERETRELLPTWDAKFLYGMSVLAPALMDRVIAKAKGT